MELKQMLVCNMLLNHGEQVELLQEFQELVEVVLPDLVKVPSVISVEKEECLLHLKPGEDGI